VGTKCTHHCYVNTTGGTRKSKTYHPLLACYHSIVQNKCHHYWPGMEPALHGEVSVVMQSEKESEEWTVREFVLSLSNAKVYSNTIHC